MTIAPRRCHFPQFVLHRAPYTAQVDPDYSVPLFASAVCSWRNAGHDARVIERGIEPAELGNGAVHHRCHLRIVTHVAQDRDCLVTGGDEPLGFGFHQVLSDVSQHDSRTCLGKCYGRR